MDLRPAAAICVVVAASTMAACSPREQVLHGTVSQLAPTICVAAPRATGECFDPSSVDTSGLALGDCVVVWTASYELIDESRPR
jgi:hypothetical protein